MEGLPSGVALCPADTGRTDAGLSYAFGITLWEVPLVKTRIVCRRCGCVLDTVQVVHDPEPNPLSGGWPALGYRDADAGVHVLFPSYARGSRPSVGNRAVLTEHGGAVRYDCRQHRDARTRCGHRVQVPIEQLVARAVEASRHGADVVL